jgi:peptidoglycan/LPS O-acetylase OafA/YrhL
VVPQYRRQSGTIRAKQAEKEITSKYEENPQSDAVRGLAVLAVFAHNTEIYPSLHLGLIVNNGWMGVDSFCSVWVSDHGNSD